MTFAGRCEARITVPTGGASVSASLGSLSSPVTVMVPAGNYFHSAAGGVSSLLTTVQNQLQDNVQGYPTVAAAMQAAVGYGTWIAGWLMNEASGNLIAAFGGNNLTPVSTPVYGFQGPIGATTSTIDKAIGFDSNADAFSGGNNYNVNAAADVAWAWVGNFRSNILANFINKGLGTGGGADGRLLVYTDGSNGVVAQAISTASGALLATCTVTNAALFADVWHVGILTIDRATGKMQLGIRTLAGTNYLSGESSITATDTTSAANFLVGVANVATTPTFRMSALYVAVGASAATGLSANLSTALANFANAVNASWTVALDATSTTATGRVTISNSFWPCSVNFTNTQLRDVLGYAYDFDYPQTAAQVTASLGSGGWSNATAVANAWLCNEATGNLAPIFGSTTLTATAAPVYGTLGARGGADKAITLDTVDILSGGVVHTVGATDDLFVVWVAKSSSTSAFDCLVSQGLAGDTAMWAVYKQSGSMKFRFKIAGVATDVLATYTPLAGEWYVGVAAIDRAAATCRIAVQGLTSGSQGISANTAIGAGTLVSANNFIVGENSGFGSNGGVVDLAYLAVVSGSGVATGAPANLATICSSFATYMKSQTSTAAAKGLWLPDDPLNLDGDPKRAPIVSDLRQTMSPTGQVFGLVGNTYKRHKNIAWAHVPKAQVWDLEATYANGSFEEFWKETQLGQGSSWFTVSSPIQIYDHTNNQVGSDANVAGWYVIGVPSVEPGKSAGDWTGYWRIEFPTIVAVGS